MTQGPAADSPIGVFDSGLGGLSVLRDLRERLPFEDFIYYADSAYCPYGGRPEAEIRQRAIVLSSELLDKGCKLIVVACNTATISAIGDLRARFDVAFVGMEPAVKPASRLTRSGVIGVLATGAALGGEKFHRLVADHGANVRIITQPCPGLVECVETGEVDGPQAQALLEQYLRPLLERGADVIVLGCTHYPFLRAQIGKIAGPDVQIIDAGAAVARQTERVLSQRQLLNSEGHGGRISAMSSGRLEHLNRCIARIS